MRTQRNDENPSRGHNGTADTTDVPVVPLCPHEICLRTQRDVTRVTMVSVIGDNIMLFYII